jgi:hypothetical protein
VEALYHVVVEKEQRQREVADYGQAHVCWVLAEVNRNAKQKATPFRIEEFLLWTTPTPTARNGHRRPAQTEDEVRQQQQAWLQMFRTEEARAQQQGLSFFRISTTESV